MSQPFRRVVSWNAKVGRNPDTVTDNLRALMDDTEPDVICLQEAGAYVGAIKERFGTNNGGNWYVYAFGDWDEARMCPVMVYAKGRDWQPQGDGSDVLRYQTTWIGPQGGSHNGRTWTWVLVDDAVVMSFHRCTDGNGRNKAAFCDEYDKVVGWASHRNRPWLVIGDHNCGPSKTFKGASKNIATNTGSKISHDDGIDYAIRHDLAGTVKHGKAYGSDHGCVWFDRDY